MSKLWNNISVETLPLIQKMFNDSSCIYSYRVSNNSTEARDKLAAHRNGEAGLSTWEVDLIKAASVDDVAYFSHCFAHVVFSAKKQGLFTELLMLAKITPTYLPSLSTLSIILDIFDSARRFVPRDYLSYVTKDFANFCLQYSLNC